MPLAAAATYRRARRPHVRGPRHRLHLAAGDVGEDPAGRVRGGAATDEAERSAHRRAGGDAVEQPALLVDDPLDDRPEQV